MTGFALVLIVTATVFTAALGALLLALLRAWLRDRRRACARADAAIDALLRARFEGDRRAHEIHGLTVGQLMDLVDIETDLDADGDLRRIVDDLNSQFPQT